MEKYPVPRAVSQVANQEAGRDSTFETELCSFLAELSRTSDMSSLENSLGRLKVAMLEEANRTDGAGMEDSDTASSVASPESTKNSSMDLDRTSGSSSSPTALGDTTDPSDTSLSSSPPRQQSALPSSGLGDDVRAYAKASRRLMFTTQTGAKFDLKDDQLENVFSKYGKVVKYKIFKKSNMGFDGFVEFSSCLVTDRLVNTLVEVGDCQLHCSLPWESLTSQPVPYQILLESRYFPHVWEKDMIIRSFFSKYGVVTGVSMIGYTSGSLLRYVISFMDPNPAMDLIGSCVKILSSTVWVREVTCDTIQPIVGPRSRASNLPWRK